MQQKTGWIERIVVFLLYAFLLAPIVIVVIISFDASSSLAFPPKSFSLRWYGVLAENEAFINGFKVSLIVGVFVGLIDVIIGAPAALALTRYRFPGRGALSAFFLSPLLVPGIVLGLGLLLVFSPLGLTGTYTGLVLAHIGVTVPYVIRTTAMSMMSADLSLEEAARTLGATRWVTFRRVTLPLVLPGLLAGFVIAFLISFDEAVISLFIVGGSATTLPVEIFHYVETRTDPQIAALSVVLIAISVLLVAILERLMGLRKVLR